MGSKFLGTDSNNLLALQDGTFNLNVATADIQSLVPSMPVRSSATHQLVSGLIGVADCSFTPLTNPATGELKMATYNITNAGSISGATNSRTADNILSCATNGVSGNLATFTGTAKVVQDSGISISSLANYLPLAGGTMTGSINMGGQEVTNISAFRVSGTNIIIGDSKTSATNTNSTAIGTNGSSTGDRSIALGHNSNASSLFGIAVGSDSIVNAQSGIAIGSFSNATGNNSICIGASSVSSGFRSYCIGDTLTNATDGSLLIRAATNIRTNSTTCDLGTSSNPFQNLRLNGYALSSAVSNRIPSVRCTYSDTTVGFGATTAETNIIDGTLSGSLTIPATTAAGFTMKAEAIWVYYGDSATTFTVRAKINGTTVLTIVVPVSPAGYQNIKCEHTFQLRSPSNRLYIACFMTRDGGLSTVVNSNIYDSLWDPAGSNVLSMTGQFSNTAGTWRGDSFELSSSYAS